MWQEARSRVTNGTQYRAQSKHYNQRMFKNVSNPNWFTAYVSHGTRISDVYVTTYGVNVYIDVCFLYMCFSYSPIGWIIKCIWFNLVLIFAIFMKMWLYGSSLTSCFLVRVNQFGLLTYLFTCSLWHERLHKLFSNSRHFMPSSPPPLCL